MREGLGRHEHNTRTTNQKIENKHVQEEEKVNIKGEMSDKW